MLTAHLNKKLSTLIPNGAPFAIAFSGGGDSTALVHALKDHPQARHVYTVDHALRKGSDKEALAVKAFAITCGYDVKLLKWKHNSPTTAIQEKARCARYGLMGEQCRRDGIKYLLTAHSEDDQAETLLMRYDRKTDWRGAAGIAELAYGPVWPELALVNIVRPLLNISRERLREYNRVNSLKWTEDPSNQNRDYARIRARDYLRDSDDIKTNLLATAANMRSALNQEKKILREQFSLICAIDRNGYIRLSDVPLPELMLHMLRAASGQNSLIDRAKIKRLLLSMRGGEFKSATLGGALVVRDQNGFVICRDPVSVKGRQDAHHARIKMHQRLSFRLSEKVQIWDGRYAVTGPKNRSDVGAVHHNYEFLGKEQRKALKAVPAAARLTLPVLICENSIEAIGHYIGSSHSLISLVKPRLEAALGGKLT